MGNPSTLFLLYLSSVQRTLHQDNYPPPLEYLSLALTRSILVSLARIIRRINRAFRLILSSGIHYFRKIIMLGTPETAPRELRHKIENKKLVEMARHVAAICRAIDSCERDYRVSEMAHKAGFTSHDLVGLRIWAEGAGFTAILVPLRFWYRPLWLHRVIELRDIIRRTGQRCIVAPASVVSKQPRLRNARLVAACNGVAVKISDQVNLLNRIVELGGLSLQDAATLIEARDPAGAVLSMVAKGQLSIESDKPIGPHTWLTLAT